MTTDPLLWLSLSAIMLALSLTAVIVVTIPVIVTLSKTAHSAEKLLDTLNRELPPTLNSLRATGQELSELTEDLGESVESAKQVVQRVDQGINRAGQQWQQLQITSQGAVAGLRAAWTTFFQPESMISDTTPADTTPARPSTAAIAPTYTVNGGDRPSPGSPALPAQPSDAAHPSHISQPPTAADTEAAVKQVPTDQAPAPKPSAKESSP